MPDEPITAEMAGRLRRATWVACRLDRALSEMAAQIANGTPVWLGAFDAAREAASLLDQAYSRLADAHVVDRWLDEISSTDVARPANAVSAPGAGGDANRQRQDMIRALQQILDDLRMQAAQEAS